MGSDATSGRSSRPVAAHQILTMPSSPPEAMRRPSGLQASDARVAVCPASRNTSSPVTASQTLMSWSPPPDATCWLSGLQARQVTQASWAVRIRRR